MDKPPLQTYVRTFAPVIRSGPMRKACYEGLIRLPNAKRASLSSHLLRLGRDPFFRASRSTASFTDGKTALVVCHLSVTVASNINVMMMSGFPFETWQWHVPPHSSLQLQFLCVYIKRQVAQQCGLVTNSIRHHSVSSSLMCRHAIFRTCLA